MTAIPTILITAPTDGPGRALAHHLAAAGAALILHGRDPGKLERTADGIRDAHHAARPRTVLADNGVVPGVLREGRVTANGLRFAYLEGAAGRWSCCCTAGRTRRIPGTIS